MEKHYNKVNNNLTLKVNLKFQSASPEDTGISVQCNTYSSSSFPLSRIGDAQLVRKGFTGCLRDVKLKHTAGPSGAWEALDWSTAVEKVAAYESWEGCPVDSEEGAHFLGHGTKHLQHDNMLNCRCFCRDELKPRASSVWPVPCVYTQCVPSPPMSLCERLGGRPRISDGTFK